MATVSDIFSPSMRKLIAAGNEVSDSDSDAQDYIVALNNYMYDFIANGAKLTWTTVTGLTDTLVLMNQATTPVDVTNSALRALIAIIAVEVAPEYGAQVDAALGKASREGERTLLLIGRGDVDMSFPNTLPKGSGNAQDSYLEDIFFSGTE